MDSVSDQVSITFSDLRSDGALEERWQVLLRVQAVFSLKVGNIAVLTDPHFNVVEFAASVAEWLRNPVADYSFRTMDAEEPDILFFRREGDRWRVGSIWGAESGVLVASAVLSSELHRFVDALMAACQQHLGTDIRTLLDP